MSALKYIEEFTQPTELRVQLMQKNSLVYQKDIIVRRKKDILLSHNIDSESIYFPAEGIESENIPFLRFENENLQLHILPSWYGFYSTNNSICHLNHQEEWVTISTHSSGSFHVGDLTLSWQLHRKRQEPPAPKAAAFRATYKQTLDLQQLIVASVIMLILSTGLSIFAFRLQRPTGNMTSLSKSQQLLLLDKGHIYAAPEFVDSLRSGFIFEDILKYFAKYNSLLANGEDESTTGSLISNHSHLVALHKNMIDEVLADNTRLAQTKLIIPAIVGESQTTMLWRFLEKIAFIQSSAKSFLESRKKLNSELLMQPPYEYDSPDVAEILPLKPDESLSEIYVEAQEFAAQSLRTSPDDEYFYANLRRQASLQPLPYMRSDFHLVHFGTSRVKDKLSKADPESSQKDAPQVH